MNNDTAMLLKECNSGCKMAIASIDQIVNYTDDKKLIFLLNDYKDEHASIMKRSKQRLKEAGMEDEKPNPMASAFSYLSTQFKMTMKNDHTQLAKIMMDGCNMGIQSIGEDIKKYSTADSESKTLARELIRSEEEFGKKMEQYL